MNVSPLCIIQARMGSTRLKNKMLLEVGGRTLIRRAWDASREAFGHENVVVAVPDTPENEPLVVHVVGFSRPVAPNIFQWDGPEDDVLGRFWHCAHRYRWHPDSVIVRVTSDDPFKDPAMMKRVANGERLPVEQGAEAFTLAMLDEAERDCSPACNFLTMREHITHAIFYQTKCDFPTAPPPPPGIWSIDTQEDLDAARSRKWDAL